MIDLAILLHKMQQALLGLTIAATLASTAIAAPLLISVSPTAVDIGSLGPNEGATPRFAVTNVSTGDVSVTSAVRGSTPHLFTCDEVAFNGRTPYVLHPGETCTSSIFLSLDAGIPAGAIGPGQTLIDFSANGGAQIVSATVAWNVLTPLIIVSPNPIAVGPAQVGHAVSRIVTLTNTSNSTITVGVGLNELQLTDCDGMLNYPNQLQSPEAAQCTAQRIRGQGALAFGVIGCQILAPHASCAVTFTYTPRIALPTLGGLTVYTDDFENTVTIRAVAEPVQTVAGTVLAVEYFDNALRHFFVTAMPNEIAALDAGTFQPWVRTGRSFWVYEPSLPVAAGESPVCRYFTTPTASFSSHFYSAFPQECEAIPTLFPGLWTLETTDAFQVKQPNAMAGTCPAGSSTLYRLYNGGPNVNHRYVTDPDTRQMMLDLGWIPEGYGPLGVGMCVPQ